VGRYWDKSQHDVRALNLYRKFATCSTQSAYNISKGYNPEVENSRKLQLMPKGNDHRSHLVTLCICVVVCVKAAGLSVWYSIVMLLDSVSSPNFSSCSL